MAKRQSNAGWIYVLDSDIEAHRDDDYRIFKIGRATNLKSRVKQLGTAYAYKPTIAYAFPVQDTIESEAELHELFKHQRLNGEWFWLGYEDLTFLSDYATNTGYFEDVTGKLIPDPMMPYCESEAIKAAIIEIDSSPAWRIRHRYFPLESKLDLPSCPLEMEEIMSPDDANETEEAIEYLEECRRQREEEEDRALQDEIASDNDDDDYDSYEYERTEESEEEPDTEYDDDDDDDDFFEITEDQRAYLIAKMKETI